jgi:hypothetical protein
VNVSLRDEMVAMAAEDEQVRAEPAADGSLFDGHHPTMRPSTTGTLLRVSAVHDWCTFGAHRPL